MREKISVIGLGYSFAISLAIFGGIPSRINVFLKVDFALLLFIAVCVTKPRDWKASLEP